jgi:serine protease Do
MGLSISNIFKLAVICALSAGLVAVPSFGQTRSPQRARSANARGIASPGYLGVGVADLTDDRVKALHLSDDQGVEVARVREKSPADKAGLKEHDVILEVNGRPVESIEEFQNFIGDASPGSKVNLTVWRNNAKQTITATLEARPADFYSFGGPDAPMPPMPPVPPFNGGNPFPVIPTNAPTVGFEGETLTPQLADYFGVRQGILVRTVNPRTPAERSGLKAGDVVTNVNGTPVMLPREITGIVAMATRNRKALSFTVVRNKKELTINIDMDGAGSGAVKPEPL